MLKDTEGSPPMATSDKKPEVVHIVNPAKPSWPCNEGKPCPVCGFTGHDDHDLKEKILELLERENK
jgi:hypothetical protein